MSNTKQIVMAATVPYNWTSEVSQEEAAIFFAWTNSPVSGLHLSHSNEHDVPNEHGGKTSTWTLVIEGIEAVGYTALEKMLGALRRFDPDASCQVSDLDDPGPPFELDVSEEGKVT